MDTQRRAQLAVDRAAHLQFDQRRALGEWRRPNPDRVRGAMIGDVRVMLARRGIGMRDRRLQQAGNRQNRPDPRTREKASPRESPLTRCSLGSAGDGGRTRALNLGMIGHG